MLIEDFKLEKWIAKFENSTEFDLSQTCVQVFSLNELENICDENFSEIKNKKLGYTDLYGSKNLKNAICNLYNNIYPENITVTLGGIGANELALKTLVNKDDKVVCICPCYQQLYSIPKFYNADVKLFFSNTENLKFDFEKLENIVGNDTKIICINNPNNPTGKEFTEQEMQKISEIAQKSNAYIFADEAYRGLNHKSGYTKSFIDIYKKSIVTGSMSKAYSLAGIRVGWIAASSDFIKKVNSNREYNTISISAIDDYIAYIALKNHKKIIKRNLNIINENKKLVVDFVNTNPNLHWSEPNCATIGCINYKYPIPSEELCQIINQKTNVMLIPATAFDCENFFRIGFGMDKNYLEQALNKLDTALKTI